MARSRSKPRPQSYISVSAIIVTAKCGPAYSFNSLLLFWGNANLSCSWRGTHITLLTFLTEQLQELLWVCADQLCQLWVTSSNTLQDWLEHLWLLLNDLSQLLKLWVVAKPIQVTKTSSVAVLALRRISSTWGIGTNSGSSLKKVNVIIVRLTAGLCLRLSSSSSTGGRRSWALLTLNIIWDTVKKVFDSTVWVEEGGTHSCLDGSTLESHSLQVRDGLSALGTHSWSSWVVEAWWRWSWHVGGGRGSWTSWGRSSWDTGIRDTVRHWGWWRCRS